MKVRAVRWGIIVLFLVAIELIPRADLVDPIALVPFSEMVWQQWLLISDGILLSHIARTLTSIVVAGALAVVTGLPLGALLWRLERTRKILQPYLTTYYAIPIFAFYPLFIASRAGSATSWSRPSRCTTCRACTGSSPSW